MMKKYKITIQNNNTIITAQEGSHLLEVLRAHGLAPEAPCGGHGSCGKCKVQVDGMEQLACQTIVNHDMTVLLPQKSADTNILLAGCVTEVTMHPLQEGLLLAFDIGTTTIAGYLLNEQGKELASASMLNPQAPFGADVISRIQAALNGQMDKLTNCIRQGLYQLTVELCQRSGTTASDIGVISIVGNPCMQQLFLGILPKNLAAVPFAPVITASSVRPAKEILPLWEHALLLTVPDISGYVGADTMGCVLSTRMYKQSVMTLMVDIGTNGEMVLGNQDRMIACSTAAGPALEGAKIQFGMRGAPGAIDHVWIEGGKLTVSVIGNGAASGICGSGLIDAVACLLELGLINARGRLQTTEEWEGDRIVHLTDQIFLTQNDIREVQMAKGAIAAGIHLMARELGIAITDIDQVLLAGAFGNFLNPKNACRIGLLPPELIAKIKPVGNAAGSGAKLLACSQEELNRTDQLIRHIDFLELASLPDFQHEFAKNMRFS